MSGNPIPASNDPAPAPADVAARIAGRTLEQRRADYAQEVRRLLDAALEVIAEHGTASRPRVADIVAAAGLSNDAFYRHFPSRDALVVALLEDGADRLSRYVAHQMGKAATPADQVTRWAESILAQAEEHTAATTLAILWNGSSGASPANRADAAPALAALLHDPFAALGAPDPELRASLVAHAVLGRLADHLWAGTRPDAAERSAITQLCLAATR